jgi:GxxExxY protein
MSRELPDDGRAAGRLVEHELTGTVIECFYRVYNELGYGFLESVYRNALALELRGHGLEVLAETPIAVFYKDVRVGSYRLDLLVEYRLALEVKATELLAPTAKRQLLNYLRATTLDVGLVLHFGPDPKFYRIVSPRLLAAERE